MNIALVTCDILAQYAAPNVEDEDMLLTRYLRERGHHVEPRVWTNPAVEWNKYDLVVVKSPWDYFDRIEEFYQWLDRIEQQQVRMLNSAAIIRWNTNKSYLRDLQAAGVRIVPTLWLPKGTHFDVAAAHEMLQADHLVVKPAVSGGAKNTFELLQGDSSIRTPDVNELLRHEDFLVQPFISQIQMQGEWSLVYLAGEYSHCVLKTPKTGDFRVQHYLGGGIEAQPAPEHLRRAADAIVAQFAANCLYARVDGLEVDGELMLMELELIEPFLYLATDAQALARYAQGVEKM